MVRPPRQVLDHWFDRDEVVAVERLAGGYLNDVYRVDTTDARYALRVGSASTAAPMVEWEIRVLAYLRAHGFPVPDTVPARDGALAIEHDGRVAVLLTFLEGDEPKRDHPAHRIAAAQMLAALHRALAGFDAPPRPGWSVDAVTPALLVDLDWRQNRLWDWSAVRGELEGSSRFAVPVEGGAAALVEEVEHHLRTVSERIEHLRRAGLPVQVVHGDYWPGNLRIADGEIRGIFDWDDTHHDWRAVEVGRAAYEFARRVGPVGVQADDVGGFIDAYRAAGGEVLVPEREAFPVLLAVARLTETLWDFTIAPLATRGEEDWEYLRASLRLLRLLEGSPGPFVS